MIARRLLIVLVYGLPILVVAFGVLMGGAAVAGAVQDAAAAQVLRWVAISCLLLLIMNVVLLVGALGINALADRRRYPDDSQQVEDRRPERAANGRPDAGERN